jgi:energy-coupling factor transporter ATP-binding protein EcfA2
MSEGSGGKSSGSGGKDDPAGVFALILIGAAILAVVLVPLVFGYLLFLLTRRWLGRRESAALLLVGASGLIWRARYCFTSYGRWLGDLVHRRDMLAGLPWLSLTFMAVTLTGVLGIVAGTRVVSRFGKTLSPHTKVRNGRSSGVARLPGEDGIVLDAEQRREAIARTRVVSPPGGALTVHADAHSVLAPQTPGKREFPIGVTLNGSPVRLSEQEIGTHGLILGSTGSGKSETIKALAGCLLDLGWSGLVLDLKEDTAPGGLRDWCSTYAQHHSTPFQELRLSDAHSRFWFNPLHGMGPDEIRDTILTLQEFEAAYWESLNKELLGQVVNLMTWAHQADPVQFPFPTMYDIAKICGSPSLPSATKKMRAVVLQMIPGVTEDDFRVLANPAKDLATSAAGLGSRLGNVYDSQAGRAVLRQDPQNSRHLVDVTLPGLTYIGLDSQGKADLTRVISSSVLQRMSVYSSQRTVGLVERGPQRFCIIDEANWVNREIVQNLLSRARGAGITMFLCTQGPKDWIDKKGDDWGKLANNLNVAIIMRQGDPESAEICAELFGKEEKTTMSESVSQTRVGPWTRRTRNADGKVVEQFNVGTELDYRVPPDAIRELTVGEAIIKVGVPTRRLEYARILMRDPTTSPRR